MTIFLNHFQTTNASISVHSEAESEFLGTVEDNELRVTLHVDVALNLKNPKLATLLEVAKVFNRIVIDAQEAEANLPSEKVFISRPNRKQK